MDHTTSQWNQGRKPGGGVRCPRCNSADTKFCYYNNYSLSQPRHLCKTCRRYWTQGGSLRSIPVGGACRKKTKSCNIKPPNLRNPNFATLNFKAMEELIRLPNFGQNPTYHPYNISSSTSSSTSSSPSVNNYCISMVVTNPGADHNHHDPAGRVNTFPSGLSLPAGWNWEE